VAVGRVRQVLPFEQGKHIKARVFAANLSVTDRWTLEQGSR